jgi:hypothetical protein
LRMSAPRSPRVSAPRWPAPRPRPKAEGVRPRGAAGPGPGPGAGAGAGAGAGRGVVRGRVLGPMRGRARRCAALGGQWGGDAMKIAVLGAGAIGVATAWHLAKQGSEVVALDRQPPARAGGGDEPRQGGRAAAWHDLASDGAGRAAQRSNGCSRSAGPGSSGR